MLSKMFILALLPVVALLLFGAGLIAKYFVDPYRLRRFPAPGYAGISSLWLALKGLNHRRSASVHEAHQKLGPVIRVQPNHLSFNEPQAVTDIYGHGSNIMKDDFYDTFESEGVYHTVATKDRAEHARKRKNLASAFAMKNVVTMEPVVRKKTEEAVAIFDQAACASNNAPLLNIRRWLNLLTFDIASALAFGNDLGFLKSGDDFAEAETIDGKRYRTHVMQALHTNSRYDVFLAHWPKALPWTKWLTSWHPGNIGGSAFIDICIRRLRDRIKDSNPRTDFFQQLLYDKSGSSRDLPFKEMVQEATVMLNAGSDPMATTMVNTLYLLMKNPEAMAKLRAEIDPVLGKDVVASFRQVNDLRYLRACIDEAMRDRPSTSLGLPRKTPREGAKIAGHQIAGGVTVSVPTYTIHHNPSVFNDPWAYKPERWIEGNTSLVKNYVIPFSAGARACIGRNVAYLEIMIVIATLVHRYNFEFESPDFVLQSIERFNTNPGHMPVKMSLREEFKA